MWFNVSSNNLMSVRRHWAPVGGALPSFHYDDDDDGAQPWAPECPNVRHLKCRLDPDGTEHYEM